MGKWTKAHFDTSKGLNAKAKFKGITEGLKDDMSPDMPGESAEEKALRNRQAMELGKLDEEENRRIKSMFAGGGGRKLFKNARSSSKSTSAAASAPGTSSAGAASPYRPGPGYGGTGSLIP